MIPRFYAMLLWVSAIVALIAHYDTMLLFLIFMEIRRQHLENLP